MVHYLNRLSEPATAVDDQKLLAHPTLYATKDAKLSGCSLSVARILSTPRTGLSYPWGRTLLPACQESLPCATQVTAEPHLDYMNLMQSANMQSPATGLSNRSRFALACRDNA